MTSTRSEEAPYRAKIRLAGAIALGLGIAAIYAAARPEQTAWIPPGAHENLVTIAAIALPVGVLIVAGDIWVSSRGQGARPGGRVALLTDYIAGQLAGWDEDCAVRATRWRRGVPGRLRVDYPRASDDHDRTWRSRVEKMIATRLDAHIVSVEWTPSRRRLEVRLRALTATDRIRATVTNRIGDVLAPLFRGVSVEAIVPVWVDKLPEPPTVISRTTPSGHISAAPETVTPQPASSSTPPAPTAAETGTQPGEIRLKYGATTLDSSEMFTRRLELVSGIKFGGRWRVEFQPQRDLGILRPRAGFPQKVDHPGGRLLDFNDPRNPTLYYGRDESGVDHGWQLGAGTKMPHSIYMGPTGGGKTTALRSLIVDAVMAGGTCFLADPKMIELSPFYGFPGCYVASSPPQIASMIDTMHALMMLRYQAILVARQQRKDVT
ncbi:FtsK/SpoIIIE domain-containing protein, partial [Rathayibacter rathayi]